MIVALVEPASSAYTRRPPVSPSLRLSFEPSMDTANARYAALGIIIGLRSGKRVERCWPWPSWVLWHRTAPTMLRPTQEGLLL